MFEDNLEERYSLVMERIGQIAGNCELKEAGFAEYFARTATFILEMDSFKTSIEDESFFSYGIDTLKEKNEEFYKDITGEKYDKSFANPTYACEKLGLDCGRLLSFLYVELRGLLVYIPERRYAEMTALLELFIEIYCICESTQQEAQSEDIYEQMREAVYWYVSDYSDDLMEYRVREMLDTSLDFACNIIMNSDLMDLRYLYHYGEYITENELRLAKYLNSLPQEKIEAMAATFTEGYRIGFELGNKDITKKKLVNIRYCVGFERLVREEIRLFEKMGLKTTVYRAAVNTINKKMHVKAGYYSTSPNRQMEYDHRFDNALYMDSQFIERKLGALRLAYDKNKEAAAVFGGPAVMEVFGEVPFEPLDKKEAFHLDAKQQKLSVKYDNDASEIVNKYIKGEERSFTIIAYPIPEIGRDFEAIFDETVRINTLDYEKYKVIQQTIIDALDGAEYVHVRGCNGNETDIKVKIIQLKDKSRQTAFENCLADVNIPLGEVFTSPVLKGTDGILNVSSVYLNELKFKNLKVHFKDGMVTDYSCDNFDDSEQGKAFFKENVLYNHDTLPLGEFAIGTNTAAYVMANRYDIVYKLPILIVEKMGPHFAIGDTCYSRAEDIAVFNPNGKEIIARDNEVSLLRKTEPEKAYFNCHTDITIPYDEIGDISAVYADGTERQIIHGGRFVLDGCEELNKPFEEN